MRSEMVPGAVLPDYELSDHTGKHRKLSELQGQDPMIVVLSRGSYCPKDRRQAEGFSARWRLVIAGWLRSARTTSRRPTNIAAVSARIGLSSRKAYPSASGPTIGSDKGGRFGQEHGVNIRFASRSRHARLSCLVGRVPAPISRQRRLRGVA